ncbi:UNVERIFIED_CONTAM: hypothetical protein Sradi_2648900 [Sesamum radiatum]|uniref:Reverse transcriptase domain-containing protein n=1 Tax=Sesamum radiatum TaxID=300843 RepID=A0AAW2S7J5_SESRA
MIVSSGKPEVVFVGDRQVVPVCVISAIQARQLMLEGCDSYLAHVIDVQKELKKQIEELSEKGFITSSTSPWGAPVLFGHVISGDGVMPYLQK